nr:hypothetical protein [Tanacetum cinerariifolium]
LFRRGSPRRRGDGSDEEGQEQEEEEEEEQYPLRPENRSRRDLGRGEEGSGPKRLQEIGGEHRFDLAMVFVLAQHLVGKLEVT